MPGSPPGHNAWSYNWTASENKAAKKSSRTPSVEPPPNIQVFEEALKYLRSGDKLVIWKLDRMGRNLQHLIETVKMLQDRGIALQGVQEKIDTSSSNGRLFFHIFGALAEFERDVIRDRTRAGLEAARARGRIGGRKNKLSSDQVKAARDLLKADHSATEVARMLQVSRSTLYRYLEE